MAWIRDLFSVFPARAGVILSHHSYKRKENGFPRTRGGDPWQKNQPSLKSLFSPHARG